MNSFRQYAAALLVALTVGLPREARAGFIDCAVAIVTSAAEHLGLMVPREILTTSEIHITAPRLAGLVENYRGGSMGRLALPEMISWEVGLDQKLLRKRIDGVARAVENGTRLRPSNEEAASNANFVVDSMLRRPVSRFRRSGRHSHHDFGVSPVICTRPDDYGATLKFVSDECIQLDSIHPRIDARGKSIPGYLTGEHGATFTGISSSKVVPSYLLLHPWGRSMTMTLITADSDGEEVADLQADIAENVFEEPVSVRPRRWTAPPFTLSSDDRSPGVEYLSDALSSFLRSVGESQAEAIAAEFSQKQYALIDRTIAGSNNRGLQTERIEFSQSLVLAGQLQLLIEGTWVVIHYDDGRTRNILSHRLDDQNHPLQITASPLVAFPFTLHRDAVSATLSLFKDALVRSLD